MHFWLEDWVEQEKKLHKKHLQTVFITFKQIKCRSDSAEKLQQERKGAIFYREIEQSFCMLNCCPKEVSCQNKEHAELKSKSFEEIQVLYERYKKQDQTFVAIGTEEDERAIKW
ncbi:hypothetical protein Tco_0911647 [Tanacetum coccineum]|uniref:Uncharacterized protein n=1 Tax=Tanacetum coccineum TaxID=301880 RepID=A0ABQ5CY07_9ASTR